MRAVAHSAGLHLVHQRLQLRRVGVHTGFDGAFAGHGVQQLIAEGGLVGGVEQQLVRQLLQSGGRVLRAQVSGYLTHQHGAVAEVLAEKAALLQKGQVVQHGGVFLTGEAHRRRGEERLRHGRRGALLEGVEAQALMGGVLVDEPEAARAVLADDIGAQHLAHHAPGLFRRGSALGHGQLLLLRLRCWLRLFFHRGGDSLLPHRRRDVIDPPGGSRGGEGLVRLAHHVVHRHHRCDRGGGGSDRLRDRRSCGSGADGSAHRQRHRPVGAGRVRALEELLRRHSLVEGLFRRFGLALVVQHVPDGVVHRVEHGLLAGELHHGLGRVDVHVHRVHRQGDMQHAAGEFALQQPVAVGLLHGGGEQLALDQPPVDEEQLPSPCAVTGGGAGDEAGDADIAAGAVHGQQASGEVAPQRGVHGAEQLAVAGGVEHLLPVPQQLEGHVRMAQRQLRHHGGGRRALGAVFFHEFHPGGGVVEQLPHADGGALRAPGGLDIAGHAALQMQGRSAVRLPLAGEDIHP